MEAGNCATSVKLFFPVAPKQVSGFRRQVSEKLTRGSLSPFAGNLRNSATAYSSY